MSASGSVELKIDESYLSFTESVVLSLVSRPTTRADGRTHSLSSRECIAPPEAQTSSDVTPRSDPQLSRAAALITSSLSFIHDLRNGYLKPDDLRGIPLDMSQYQRLFATCRVPTDVGRIRLSR